jgi:hypothetical protein
MLADEEACRRQAGAGGYGTSRLQPPSARPTGGCCAKSREPAAVSVANVPPAFRIFQCIQLQFGTPLSNDGGLVPTWQNSFPASITSPHKLPYSSALTIVTAASSSSLASYYDRPRLLGCQGSHRNRTCRQAAVLLLLLLLLLLMGTEGPPFSPASWCPTFCPRRPTATAAAIVIMHDHDFGQGPAVLLRGRRRERSVVTSKPESSGGHALGTRQVGRRRGSAGDLPPSKQPFRPCAPSIMHPRWRGRD